MGGPDVEGVERGALWRGVSGRESSLRDTVWGCHSPVTQDHQCHRLLLPQQGLPGRFIPGYREKAVLPCRGAELSLTYLSWETFLF